MNSNIKTLYAIANKPEKKIIGLMSGSSLDGLDIAYCEFRTESNKWSFKILKTSVVEYPDEFSNPRGSD